MRLPWLFLLLSLVSNIAGATGRADTPAKADGLPARYRDFKVYATSEPDPRDPSHIVATVQFHNEGSQPLQMQASLEANPRAGWHGAVTRIALKPHTINRWILDLHPPDGLHYEVLKGAIAFNNVPDRELYIAVQGPDPAGATNMALDNAPYWAGNIGPDANATQRQTLRRITAKAEVVGAYAPRVTRADWQSRAQATLHPNVLVKPLLTLAAAGRTDYRIVVEPMPHAADGSALTLDAWSTLKTPRPGEPELAFAVSDLQRCLKLMSDATLPVTGATVGRGASGPAIRLRLNDKRKWAHPDAFHLFTRRGDVIIESGHLDGLRQGIYSLLTDYLDCHWFLPGQIGEEIPRPADRTVLIGQIDEERSPSFSSVGGMGGGRHWDVRNRSYINRGRMSFGHSWRSLISPAEFPYEKFPDMWARDRQGKIRNFDMPGGWSFTNFCTTSPQVIEVVAKKINQRLLDPEALVGSLEPNDFSLPCLCDRCLALDAKYGVTNQDGNYVTDRLLHFSQEIYNRLEPQNKAKFLGVLVYARQMELPKSAVPHAHHTGIVCDMDWTYDHTRPFNDPSSPQNRDFYRLIQGWTKILPRAGFYDYYGHYRLLGPWGVIHKMREDLPAFRDMGGDYLMIEAQPNFGMHGLNLYIASQLAWNVDADVDALIDEFCAKFYGPANAPMRRYWLAIERRYALSRPGPDAIDRVTANPELWLELDGYLKQAEAAVAGADKKYQDRIMFHRDGFEWGRRQHDFINLYARRDTGLNAAETLAYLEQTTQWLNTVKKKYLSPAGYWPTLVAPFLYSGTEEKIAELEAQLKAEQGKAR
jgi:hypothetical protein